MRTALKDRWLFRRRVRDHGHQPEEKSETFEYTGCEREALKLPGVPTRIRLRPRLRSGSC
jgi:hypothetical protein